MLTTKQLRYFDALARLGHFTRAAEFCSVSQPALSMQISQMERELGLDLVERQGSAVALTAAGREVARRVAQALKDIHEISEYAVSCQTPFTAPLRLGVIPTIAPYLLPRLLPQLKAEYPQLSLHIRESQTNTLIKDLRATELDVIVVALPVDMHDLDTVVIRDDKFLLAVPANASEYPRSRIAMNALDKRSVILLEEGHCLRDQAVSACSLKSGDETQVLGAASLSTLVQMVSNGLGVTLLPEIAARSESAHSGIRVLRFTNPEPRRVIGLAWRKSCARGDEFMTLAKKVNESLSAAEKIAV